MEVVIFQYFIFHVAKSPVCLAEMQLPPGPDRSCSLERRLWFLATSAFLPNQNVRCTLETWLSRMI